MGRILVIDDEETVLEVVQQILERHGYDVLLTDDGDEGIRLCREEEVDLVITDVIMPNKEGLEIILELRRNFPNVKVIAMSGGGHIGPNEYLDLAAKMGAQRTLNKPFVMNDLLIAVREVLGNADFQQSL